MELWDLCCFLRGCLGSREEGVGSPQRSLEHLEHLCCLRFCLQKDVGATRSLRSLVNGILPHYS